MLKDAKFFFFCLFIAILFIMFGVIATHDSSIFSQKAPAEDQLPKTLAEKEAECRLTQNETEKTICYRYLARETKNDYSSEILGVLQNNWNITSKTNPIRSNSTIGSRSG